MKKIITILLVIRFAVSFGQAQIHYDSVSHMSYANFVPQKWKRTDSITSMRVYARSFSDNLFSSVSIYWEVRDSLEGIHDFGNYTLTDTFYTHWQSSSNWYIFQFLSSPNNLNITLTN